ncbi:hypothetical protein LG651_14180 [Tamlana sp. 62-3]|uniref:Uncharacterized protein n=1 Tax=Neotamlana sargassicola TaxID=2883125 RepID=A0A9X1I7S6_9FLAO|nr:hypothetical protein [Tamlana sargassicola]MCB4809400.1 hypothetical protein [Tamlana sargassicola]
MAKKTWIEKRDAKKEFVVKTIDKKFADIPEGSRMLIATPQIINTYVNNIPFGKTRELTTMRTDLAATYNTDKTCPVTAGIFLRIVAEAAYEELENNGSIEQITPFWRIVSPNSKLAKKLSCGEAFIINQRIKEGC